MKTIKCFRFVNQDMTSNHDNRTKWKLKEWLKVTGMIKPCENGLHACKTPTQSIDNVYGSKWFMAEARGKIVEEGSKFAASEMRLIKEIPFEVLTRFALWCAKDCLKYYTAKYPDDSRVADCIRITEDFLDGKATIDAVRAAYAAARAAARAAADAADAADAYAAYAAARAAAYADAYAAARAAARKRQAQELNRLIKEYMK